MTRTSRLSLLTLTALVAACLFTVAVFAQNASANITPSLTASYADGGSAGTHSNYTQSLTFNNSGDNVQSGEDVRSLAFDFPAGLIGDPNAIAPANRCNFTNAANTTPIDYNGGAAGSGAPGDVTPSSVSPDYDVCGTSDPGSMVGNITVSVTAVAVVLFIPITCQVTLPGEIYMLQNRPGADPEVPAYLGIHVEGSAGGICALGGTSKLNLTTKITLRPTDNGLRVVVIDDVPRAVPTNVDANTDIRLNTVSLTVNGMAASGKPFLTEPTRCDAWSTKAYARGWASNTNVDSDVNPVDAVNEMKASTSSTTPNCGSLIPAAPTFSLTNSPSTATQAGAPTGLRATLTNPVPTGNTKQPAYPREFNMALPVGYKINPTVANRLGGVGGGCTEAQFLVPAPGTPVSDATPTCPTTSEIGTVAVTVPEITGDLYGKVYLGEPRPGDEAAGIYRLYIQATRAGVTTKFQGTATADAGTGQVSVAFKNISSFNAAGGLPQFNYSKFDMDFNSASTGIGLDPSGNPISNPVASPSVDRQMLLNPQVCGSYAPVVTVKPWTSPNQGDVTPTVAPLNVTAGTNGSCNFLGFNPTVAAKLRNSADTADLTDAGSHPDMTFTVTRPDRMDNMRDLVIDFPSGFAGSAAVVTPANLCTAAQASSDTCPAASKVGSVQVLTGGGVDTAALNGSIYMTTTEPGDTATLAVVVPAKVGPFNLGTVVLTTHMTIPSGSSFSLRASTMNMPQSILGIPILYRSIALKLNGTVNSQSFLTVPSTCGQNLNFLASITSNGDAPGTAGTGVVSTVTPSASAGSVTNCAAAQGFAPTISIDKSDGATGTYQAGAQTGINVTVNSPVTTPPQSTIKKVEMTFPSGMEINPAFAANRTACPTATLNAITGASDGCATGFASSLIGNVTVNTPLLANPVSGQVYLEAPGPTRDTRYKIALVLFMPGGVQIIHGSTTIDSGLAGSTAAVGATGLTNTGTGQIKAVFDGLPDVAYTSMVLKFSDPSRPQMFVNPPSCGAKTWAAVISPTNTAKAAVNATPGYTTTDSNCAAVNSAWAPTFGVTTTNTAAGAHPNVSMTVTRPDLNQQLRDVVFDLPAGFTGAAAATATTCTQASADAATCATTAASSNIGSVAVKIGSGSTPATVTGGIYNTVAPSTAPAKLTAIVPVTLGPFSLGSLPVSVGISMNDDYSLRASVLNLPSRYEGIAVRYQELKVSLNGMTTDNKPFLTNPSTCPSTPANFTASVTSAVPTTTVLTAPYPVTSCGNFTGAPNGPGIAVSGLSTTQQTPTGMNVSVTNTLSTAVTNPTIRRVQLAFPAGFTLNPAIGNNAGNTVCAAGNFSVNAAPTCPAQSKVGSVSLITPLLKNGNTGDGSWPGSVYLTSPGSARETRYQIKIVIPIPGKYIVISGSATADAGATGSVGATGLTDSGTGVVSTDFNNLPDLGFTNMALTFDASSSGHQLLVTPSSQVTGNVVGTVSPSTGGTAVTQNSSYTGAAAAQTFAPTFSASLSSVAAGASPTLTVDVTNAGSNVKQLRNFNMHLPTGLVANGSATATRCTQPNANAANCAGTSAIGTITTVIGATASENFSLPGTLYNVDPSNNEPARLQAVVPVNVGPYALGSLTIPVTTAMRSDNGIDTLTTLPRRYEGIDVFVRSLSLEINAPNYLINPSACGAAPISADFIAGDGGAVNGVTSSPVQTIGSCARNYGTAPTLNVTPTTTETAKPTGLTFTIGSTISNPTTQSIGMTFPQGIEFNPAGAAAMGPAGACPLATVQTNAAACPALSIIGTTTLNTPLLANPVNGTVYLETPGSTATTRYKANIALNIPGRAQPLVIQGRIQVNGSTTIASGGTGSTDPTGTATGQITASFEGIPDIGFTSMVVAFAPQAPNASNPPLFVNPTTCTTASNFSATFTPHGTGNTATANSSYSTDNTNCGTGSTFNPGFSFTPGTTTPAAHPDLTLSFTRPDFNRSIRSLTVSLPTGLVAATANATQCDIASATAGNCATTAIGSADTTFGSGSTASASGTVYNVTPSSSNEPARFQVIMPVTVGPFDLGTLSVPISTSLRSDLGIDATATLPLRYEGISVRLRTLNIKLFGSVGSAPVKNFLTMPSNCAVSSIGSTMTSDGVSPSTATNTSVLNVSGAGCGTTFPVAPTMTVTPTSGSSKLAAEPVNLTFGIHSDANNPTIKRVAMTFPSGMEINPGFANNAAANALTCPTATINSITTSDACASGFPSSKIANITMVTPLLASNPTGAVYLESPGSTEASRYRVVMVIQLPGRYLVVRGSIDVPGDSTIPSGGTGVVGGTGGPITADFNNIPDLGFTDLTLEFNSTRPLVVNPETCTAGSFSGDFYPWSSGIKTTATSAWTSTSCASPTPFDPSFSVQVDGGSSVAATSHPDLTLSVARADKSKALAGMTISLPQGLVANTGQVVSCPNASAVAATCASTTPYSQVGTFTASFGSGTDVDDPFTLSNGKLFQTTPQSSSEPVRFQAILPVVVGPFDLGNLTIPVSSTLRNDLGIDITTDLPTRYEGISVRMRTMVIAMNGTVATGPSSSTSYMVAPSKCQSNDVSAMFTAADSSNDTNNANNSSSFTTTNCEDAQYNPAISAALSTTQRGKPVGLDLGFEFSGNSSSTKKIVTTFPKGMGINPGVGNYGSGMTCSDANFQAGGALCPSSSNLGTVTLNTSLLPTTQTGALYLLPPVGNQASTRYRLGLFVDLPGTGDLYTTGSVTVSGSSDVPAGGAGAVNTGDGQVVATFDDLPDLQFNDLTIHFKTTGGSDHALLTNPNTCGTFNLTAEMSPWSRPTTSEPASTSFTTTDNVAGCIETESADQSGYLSSQIGTGAESEYVAGESKPVTMTVNRPNSDKSIKRVKILLPPGLVGSADAAPTCLQADADAGNCGSTEPGSQIGTVTLKIGDSADTYEISGGLYNTVAPSNRPAKFTFIADVNVGPFAFGKVIVPVDVNLDSNDYSLFAETGDMPQVFEGIPVRINQMQISLVGKANEGTPDEKIFMSNPRSCGDYLHIRAVITSVFDKDDSNPTTKNADSQLQYKFTGCENLNLNADDVTIENQPVAPETGHGAEHPTGLNVHVHQDESLTTQATLKNLRLDLPGFRLSAPAANGLDDCSAAQLDAETCPEASRVGTAWIDTSLLPKDQTSPDGPGSHSLWGAVYLETPGTAPDGSDRYKLTIQLTGKTLITLRGIAHVDETTGEITTNFDDLPDIPFTDFHVELTGYKKVTGVAPDQTTTYFPLLLNPVGVIGSSSSVEANANLTPHSGTDPVDRKSTLPIDSALEKTFTPNATSDIAPLTSGGHPTANFVISRGDAQEDIKNVTMQLPAGFLGSAAAVPLCPLTNSAAGTCNDLSKVGDVIAKIGQYGQTLTLPGKVYLTEGVGGDIAGMSIKVPAKAGPYDLGDYITQGRIQIRPTDHGITANFVDVPKMFKGVPTHIQNLDITLPGEPNGPNRAPFLYNASDCSQFSIVTTLTPYVGAAVSDSDDYRATGCPARPFRPAMSFAATTKGDERTAPAWTIKMHTEKDDSTLKSTTVVLPSVMTVNVAGLGDACAPDQVTSRTCPASSKIGTVTVDTPLLPTPVIGTVYMARSVSGQSLPDMLIDIPAPIDMQIRGANSFVTANNAASQIKSTFSNLPDLIWHDLTMNITGGPKGILGLRGNGACGWASSSFSSHSGQGLTADAPVTGLEGYCDDIQKVCTNPTVKVSTKGAKKKGNKKASTSLSLSTANNCKAIQAMRVSYPKGTKINKKLIKWAKTKNKKLAKTYKANLKNLTGRAGSKSLTAKDFALSGSNGLKFKSAFPANTRSFSINTKNSSLLPSYKTFCGDITKKKYKTTKKYKAALKKCQKKNVTFTFEVTNVGGTAYRFNYTAPAGSKIFK